LVWFLHSDSPFLGKRKFALSLSRLGSGESLLSTIYRAFPIQFSDSQIRVLGKGKKIRMLPLDRDSVKLLDHYLCLERPPYCGQALFVCLKGPSRGKRITPAGLRSLFRHHRQATGVTKANPHRFRHTFAADMLRAGVSLPALMQLMGHAQIQTTMVYLQLTPQDVWEQYARAVAHLTRHTPPSQS